MWQRSKCPHCGKRIFIEWSSLLNWKPKVKKQIEDGESIWKPSDSEFIRDPWPHA